MIILNNLAQSILHDLNAASTLLLIFAGTVLWCKPGRGRAQTALALIMAVWAIPYVAGSLAAILNVHIALMGGVLPVPYLVGGTFYMIVLLLLPIELLCPGWCSPGRTIMCFVPWLVIGGSYYLVIGLLGQVPEPIWTYSSLMEHISEFSIWFRFVILAMFVGYIIWGYIGIYRFIPRYSLMCAEELGSGAEAGMIWLRDYTICLCVILLTYCSVVFIGSVWCEAIHTVVLQIFFVYMFFKSWNYVNPCLINDMHTHQSTDETNCQDGEPTDESLLYDERQFEEKIPDYRQIVEDWFNLTRPYLNPEFKLIDVMAVLPLNRTYLSRVFNDGFGANFSAVVRSYRLNHAESLLVMQPPLSIVEVARQSGFSSSSVFHRAFLASKGITPLQFRKNYNRR